MPPFVGGLGEPVEEDHDLTVVRPRRPHVEREVADVDLRQGDPVTGLTRAAGGFGDGFTRFRRLCHRIGRPAHPD